MRKHLLAIMMLLAFALPARAQDDDEEEEQSAAPAFRIPTGVGNYMVGANLLLANAQFQKGTETSYDVALSPKAGFFVLPNLALGLSVSAGVSGFKSYRSITYSATPFLRAYFAHNNEARRRPLQAFVEGGLGIGGVNTRIATGTGSTTLSSNGLRFYLLPGIDYFLNERVAAEAGLQYSFTGGSPDVHVVGLSLGLQIFLGR